MKIILRKAAKRDFCVKLMIHKIDNCIKNDTISV